MSWGTELWDRYDAMCTYTSAGVDFLENSVAKFMKENGLHSRALIFPGQALRISYLVNQEAQSGAGGSASWSGGGGDQNWPAPRFGDVRKGPQGGGADEERAEDGALELVRHLRGRVVH